MWGHLQDIGAIVVAVTLSLGVLVLAFYQVEIPGEISTALGSAVTWLFVRSVQAGAQAVAEAGAHPTPLIVPKHD